MTEWLQLVNTHPGFPKRNPNHPAGIFDVGAVAVKDQFDS